MGPGVIGTGYLFADLVPASIAGTVFTDTNNDGVPQAGESGVAGVTVTLVGTDDRGQAVNLSTMTGGDGSYAFSNLRPGLYGLVETPPPSSLSGHDSAGSQGGTVVDHQITSIPIASGTIATAYTFAQLPPNSLSGTVYSDANDDGVIQAGETGMSGVTVTLTGIDDLGQPVLANVTTGENGSYIFANRRPGTYAVAAATPVGVFTGKASPGNLGGSAGVGRISGVVLADGATSGDNNFGLLSPAAVSGFVYDDGNDDGVIQPNESGIAGVTVTLTGTDDNGQSIATTMTTADNGSYDFTNLRPGTYAVTETSPTARLDGKVRVGSAGGTAVGRQVSGIMIAPGQTSSDNDFATLRPASLSGTVYDDPNNDGVKQPNESGIAGVSVTLSGTDDNGRAVLTTLTTAVDGSYDFTNLRPGQYALASVTPADEFVGRTTVGTPGGIAGPSRIGGINLTAGTDGSANNFATLRPAALSGSVYVDTNGDGVRQSGEPGVAGVTVTLTGTDDLGNTVRTGATTAGDGSYAFNSLRPGLYTLNETHPAGYSDGIDAAGTAGGTVGVDTVGSVPLAPGVLASGYTFAEQGATVSGKVFLDLLGDGTLRPGSPGVAGSKVSLLNPAGQIVAQTVTGPDGTYSFPGVLSGAYQIVVDHPNPDGTRSTSSESIVVRSGVPVTAITPVDAETGVVSGTVFSDGDDNGVRGASETGVGGVVVRLTGTDAQGRPVSRVTTTASGGNYAIRGLPSGTYTVSEVAPAGFLSDRVAATSTVVSLGVGQTGTASFALLPPSSLSGTVYLDANRNGLDDNEFGIAHVVVSLIGANDLGQVVRFSTVTDSDGRYRFDSLRPGSYAITRGASPAFFDAKVTVGSVGGSAKGLQVTAIAVGGGVAAQHYEFGQKVKPGCVLVTPAFRAILAQGPHPAGPIGTSAARARLGHRLHPNLGYWLPRLAAEL